MVYDAIIVGGGAAGLTAAAFLSKYGRSPLLLEKQSHCGGLVNAFKRDGFTFDGGVRAFEDAGVLFPMLKKLGINIEFVKNRVSVGIADQVIEVESTKNLADYEVLLKKFYPESQDEITAIIAEIKKITHLMDIQYGIDNPLFLDIKEDRDYFAKEVFPWMFKYVLSVPKVSSRTQPVVPYLQKFTKNQALLDIIAQHFFIATPAYFALSYFRLYQDYHYPLGGTAVFPQKLMDYIQQHGGEIRTNKTVESIDLDEKLVTTKGGEQIQYRQLLWAADQNALYRMVNTDKLSDYKTSEIVIGKRNDLAELSGNDSVLTVFLSTHLDKNYFENICTGHFFYTPRWDGITKAGAMPVDGTWEEIRDWLNKFFEFTTYEISIPVVRDSSLAPDGKTGLIVSVLFDYKLTKHIYDHGWEKSFKDLVIKQMVDVLNRTIFPGLKEAVMNSFTATPITLKKMTGNTDGAITGWAFTNKVMPAENRLIKIANAVKTPLDNVTQAGQWTYSPSGFPVALITGKLAADRVNKLLT